jgi:hypothetical protein
MGVSKCCGILGKTGNWGGIWIYLQCRHPLRSTIPFAPSSQFSLRYLGELGMVRHSCNPSTQEAKTGAEDLEYKASLGYIVRPCFKKGEKKKMPGLLTFGLQLGGPQTFPL